MSIVLLRSIVYSSTECDTLTSKLKSQLGNFRQRTQYSFGADVKKRQTIKL